MRSETRHQLKKDQFAEKLAEKAGSTVHWAVEHRTKIYVGAAVAIAVLVAAIGGWMYLRNQERKAALALAQAMTTYQAPVLPPGTPPQPGLTTFNSEEDRAKAANTEFRAVADKYSTASGKIGRYMAGVTSMEMGATSEAEKDFKQVADKADKDLASLAKLALASLYRQTNRADDAINVYKDLADHPTRSVSKTMAQLEMASTYAARNETARARDIYNEIIKQNPEKADAASVGVELANERLAALPK